MGIRPRRRHGTALIEGQGAECAAFFGSVGLDRLEHGGRIGHLGHDLGIDEAGNFQLLGTAIESYGGCT